MGVNHVTIYTYSKLCWQPKINTMLSVNYISRKHSFKIYCRDFPGGTVVKNLPANAGDTGSSPGPGRSHMLWSN